MTKKAKKVIISLIILLLISIYSVYNNNLVKEKINKREEIIPVNYDTNLSIYFIDVGQGDSILIKENDKNVLIDAGNNEDGEKLVNYIKGLKISRFDYVFGTHAHEDHIGGMDDIIRNFDIDNFYMPDAITTTKTFEDVLDSLTDKKIKLQIPSIDEEINLNNAKFKVLYTGEEEKDLNNTSIVLKLIYGNNSFLLMGDATSSVEEKLINNHIDLKSDVLKVGHHGSSYSTTKDFLKEVSPKYAVIEVGMNNTYNHPRKKIINRLKEIGATIYRTDMDGTILMKSDGNNINIETFKTDTNG